MEIGIWKITESHPQRYQRGLIPRESQLEDWIEHDPALLSPGLSIVGRQLIVSAGRLDLLGLDQFGHWVIVEIKRGEVRRETIMQAVDYAADIDQMDSHELERHVEAYLTARGNSLKQLLKERRWDRTILDERNPLIYVVGTIPDPHLDRMAAYLKNRGNLDINVVTFDIYENDEGEQLIVRQLTELETGTKTRPVREPAQRTTSDLPATEDADLQRLFMLADKNGIGQEFRGFYEQATKHGLYPRLHKWSIMYAPPTNKTRALLFTPVKRRKGVFDTWIGSKVFAEFFPVHETDALKLLGPEGWTTLNLSEVNTFSNQMDKLFAVIEKNKK